MTNSKDEDLDRVKVTKKNPQLTPPGYQIELSEAQAITIAEFVDSNTFKLLKNVYVAQRKDHIARTCLNSAQTDVQLHYFKGMVAELSLFFRNLEGVKKALNKGESEE